MRLDGARLAAGAIGAFTLKYANSPTGITRLLFQEHRNAAPVIFLMSIINSSHPYYAWRLLVWLLPVRVLGNSEKHCPYERGQETLSWLPFRPRKQSPGSYRFCTRHATPLPVRSSHQRKPT